MRCHRRLDRWVSLIGLGLGCVTHGCGDEPLPVPDFGIAASAVWSNEPAGPDALGYTMFLLTTQLKSEEGLCRRASASTRLTINDVDVPLVRDPATRCLEGRLAVGPLLQDHPPTFSARLEEDGRPVAEALFDDLLPGTTARLVSPADGRVKAGDELVIIPPQALPTSEAWGSRFYFMDAPDWQPLGVAAPTPPRRLLDGIHVEVPAFTGRAVLIIRGMPFFISPEISCPGFALCTATVATTVGPILLTGAP